jgi:nucleoside-diphosphate-sugar epimerase
MPTLALHPGATIFVTGVNGLIGSHIADQLLARGYHVRGAVRDVEKTKWLAEYFTGKHKAAKFELVSVPDMTTEGCYDEAVKGTSSLIHLETSKITDANARKQALAASSMSHPPSAATTPILQSLRPSMAASTL